MAGRLQHHIGATGRARSILHYGPKETTEMAARLEFEAESGLEIYGMRLTHAAGDMLVFAEENVRFLQTGREHPKSIPLGAGHEETRIIRRPRAWLRSSA